MPALQHQYSCEGQRRTFGHSQTRHLPAATADAFLVRLYPKLARPQPPEHALNMAEAPPSAERKLLGE